MSTVTGPVLGVGRCKQYPALRSKIRVLQRNELRAKKRPQLLTGIVHNTGLHPTVRQGLAQHLSSPGCDLLRWPFLLEMEECRG